MQSILLKGVQENYINAKLFKPQASNGICIIICPATGVQQRYYYNFAGYLKDLGYTVMSFDYQGIGESKPENLRGFKCSATDWCYNNLTQVIDYVTTQLKPDKLILLGHSIGGQFIGLCKASAKADAIILVGSQIGYWKLWPPSLQPRMWFNWHVLIPAFAHVFGYLPAKKLGIMEDLPKAAALEWARWCKSPNHFFDYHRDAEASFASLKVPLTSYSFEDDIYAPEKPVDRLLDKYSNCTIRKKHLKPGDYGLKKIGHFGMFKKKNKEHFWADLLQEIEFLSKNQKKRIYN